MRKSIWHTLYIVGLYYWSLNWVPQGAVKSVTGPLSGVHLIIWKALWWGFSSSWKKVLKYSFETSLLLWKEFCSTDESPRTVFLRGVCGGRDHLHPGPSSGTWDEPIPGHAMLLMCPGVAATQAIALSEKVMYICLSWRLWLVCLTKSINFTTHYPDDKEILQSNVLGFGSNLQKPASCSALLLIWLKVSQHFPIVWTHTRT